MEEKRAADRAKERGLHRGSKRKTEGRLVERQVVTNWIKALAQLSLVYPERIGGLVEHSTTADRLTDHPEELVTQHGAPTVLRSNNEPEFIFEVIADWADTHTGLFYIPPRSPRHNEYIESFNNRLRDQCLNINNFSSPIHTRVLITDWKSEHNHTQPHSPLGHPTPT